MCGRGLGSRHGRGQHSTSPFEWDIANVSSSTSGLPLRQLLTFSQPVGPVPRKTRGKHTVEDVLFVSFTLLDLIIDQTWLLAVQQTNEYFNITMDELFAFIGGINVAMGLVRLPRAHDYWSTSPIFCLPWFSAVMPRNRFYEISKYLHLADASKQKTKGEDGYDPLYKGRRWL